MRRTGTRFGRRATAQKPASSGPVIQTVFAGQGWDTTNRLGTAAGSGNRGDATNGHWYGIVMRCDAVPSATEVLGGVLDSSGKGYSLTCLSGPGLRFRNGNAAGNAFVDSPVRTIVAGDVAKTHAALCIYTGSTDLKVRLIFDTAEVGAPGTTTTGYTAPGAGVGDMLGSFSGGAAAVSWSIIGDIGGVGVPSAGEITAWFAAVKSAGAPVAIPGKTDHAWPIPSGVVPTFPATVPDMVGASNRTFVAGTSAGVDLVSFPPTWGW